MAAAALMVNEQQAPREGATACLRQLPTAPSGSLDCPHQAHAPEGACTDGRPRSLVDQQPGTFFIQNLTQPRPALPKFPHSSGKQDHRELMSQSTPQPTMGGRHKLGRKASQRR